MPRSNRRPLTPSLTGCALRAALLIALCAAAQAAADPLPLPVTPAPTTTSSTTPPAIQTPGLDAAAALRAYIARMESAQPGAFAAVAAARASVPRLDRQRRGPFAVISRPLRALGPDALAPMLSDLLAASDLDAGPLATWGERQRTTWTVGLLEAVGSLRDPVALPALLPFLDDPRHPTQALFAATQAIGKLGTDDAAALIAGRVRALSSAKLQADDPRRDALLSAAGSCRRAACADALRAVALALPPDASPATTRALIRALYDTANAQAWKTPTVAASGERDLVRDAAAAGLTGLWHSHPDARPQLTTAFRIIDAPTP